MSKPTPTEIIAEAFDASRAAGLAQFERDGRRDIGSCGGFILVVDARGAVAKALMASGQGRKSVLGGVVVRVPSGNCRSQHRMIPIEAGRAAEAVFAKHGVRVTEARSYVD